MNGRLVDYVGCACEVKTMDNDLLMVGKIRAVISEDSGQALEIVSSDGEELPTAAYGIPVKLNIFNSKLGFLGVGGRVYITHNTFWRINDISTLGVSERRGYFRIKVHTYAEVTGPSKANEIKSYKCLVTSVSLSGLLMAIEDDSSYFREGTDLEVRGLRVGESPESFNVKCEVRRIDENQAIGKLYGCQFVEMKTKETDRLCQEIFAKQRQDIQKKRGRPQ